MANEYEIRQKQIHDIIEHRMLLTQEKKQWSYSQQIGKANKQPPIKYQVVNNRPKVELTDDIRNLIYDEKVFPNDSKVFTSSDWQLTPIDQKPIKFPSDIPTMRYLNGQSKAKIQEIDQYFGKFQMEGVIKAKSNEISWNTYHYNLRNVCLIFYNPTAPEKESQQKFLIWLDENAFDYTSETDEFITLKGDKVVRIKKQSASAALIKRLLQKLLFFSFRGAFALRFQVPPSQLQDYIYHEIDNIQPVDLSHQGKIKQHSHLKYYRDAIGSFMGLLDREAAQRINKAAIITIPQWLKQTYRRLPKIETWLITNIPPGLNPLMNLKIQISQNQYQGLLHTLKYCFHFMKNYVKRTLIVYDSELKDDQVNALMNQINYPMHTIGFPKNTLTKTALELLIDTAGNYCHEIIDMSYNSKLTTLNDCKILSLCNSNPSVKSIILKGTSISQGQQDEFFEGLRNSLTIQSIQLDYYDHYNQAMVQNLINYDAILY